MVLNTHILHNHGKILKTRNKTNMYGLQLFFYFDIEESHIKMQQSLVIDYTMYNRVQSRPYLQYIQQH